MLFGIVNAVQHAPGALVFGSAEEKEFDRRMREFHAFVHIGAAFFGSDEEKEMMRQVREFIAANPGVCGPGGLLKLIDVERQKAPSTRRSGGKSSTARLTE
ncbi:hypothetical protein JKP88DRAFT_272469 [Tribonema minus]|uniref:Uncharacterized protein n=1 Tax=Tribonema minus TaxID=303371 RepID=A0A836CPV7_9STRA|nr:hypothetical protein JKP88DRAFT_272469 [Tribonema minus]